MSNLVTCGSKTTEVVLAFVYCEICFQPSPTIKKSVPLTKKKLFLIDGAGATTSATFLILIAAEFQSAVGMPTGALYALAATACVFAVYSFSCFLIPNLRRAFFLRIIAAGNLAYGAVTAGVVAVFFEEITPIGLLYFATEISVVVFLALTELRIASRNRNVPA